MTGRTCKNTLQESCFKLGVSGGGRQALNGAPTKKQLNLEMNQNLRPHLHFTHLILAAIAPRFPSSVHFSKRFPIYVHFVLFLFSFRLLFLYLYLFKPVVAVAADYLIGTRVCTALIYIYN